MKWYYFRDLLQNNLGGGEMAVSTDEMQDDNFQNWGWTITFSLFCVCLKFFNNKIKKECHLRSISEIILS